MFQFAQPTSIPLSGKTCSSKCSPHSAYSATCLFSSATCASSAFPLSIQCTDTKHKVGRPRFLPLANCSDEVLYTAYRLLSPLHQRPRESCQRYSPCKRWRCSPYNNMDLVHGLSLDSPAHREIQYIFSRATVIEETLIALNHMQVSICTVGRIRNGMSMFRKNIIFQELNEFMYM